MEDQSHNSGYATINSVVQVSHPSVGDAKRSAVQAIPAAGRAELLSAARCPWSQLASLKKGKHNVYKRGRSTNRNAVQTIDIKNADCSNIAATNEVTSCVKYSCFIKEHRSNAKKSNTYAKANNCLLD